ncbi:hypothetical protein STEG23_022816 [Scotinomys teguina]
MEGVPAAAEFRWCFLCPCGPGGLIEVLSPQGWNDLAGLKKRRKRGGRQGKCGKCALRRGARVSVLFQPPALARLIRAVKAAGYLAGCPYFELSSGAEAPPHSPGLERQRPLCDVI